MAQGTESEHATQRFIQAMGREERHKDEGVRDVQNNLNLGRNLKLYIATAACCLYRGVVNTPQPVYDLMGAPSRRSEQTEHDDRYHCS